MPIPYMSAGRTGDVNRHELSCDATVIRDGPPTVCDIRAGKLVELACYLLRGRVPIVLVFERQQCSMVLAKQSVRGLWENWVSVLQRCPCSFDSSLSVPSCSSPHPPPSLPLPLPSPVASSSSCKTSSRSLLSFTLPPRSNPPKISRKFTTVIYPKSLDPAFFRHTVFVQT